MTEPNEEQQAAARAVLQRAIPYIEQGWCQDDYARTADGRPTNPLAEDAACWCIDGACMRAQADTGASRAAMHLVRKALTLVCSARRGAPQHPFLWANAYNDQANTTRAHVVSALRGAADLVPVAHLVQGCLYPYGWWKAILKQAREGA